MGFQKLSLIGFKSFPDSEDVEIKDGLTGIVGPNGCGKSNLVEGLRWVMGESSSKFMRGESMDDVIFAGTDRRSARNIAEVKIGLDNRERKMPEPYNKSDYIEITRHIERRAHSFYRINGEEVRAKDVALFFSDFMGGSKSSALVGQGRIDEIVLSKPQQRKAIIEEAASITGLHVRRHEAELKLNRTQSNIELISENLKQTKQRLGLLKKQSNQAKRYTKTSHEITLMEALLDFLKYHQAQKEYDDIDSQLKTISAQAESQEEGYHKARDLENDMEQALSENRYKSDAALANYERLKTKRALLENEEKQILDKINDLIEAKKQIAQDKIHAEEMHNHHQEQYQILEKDQKSFLDDKAQSAHQSQASQKTQDALSQLKLAEDKAHHAREQISDWQAQKLSLEHIVGQAQTRLSHIESEQQNLSQEMERLSAFDKELQLLDEMKNKSDEAKKLKEQTLALYHQKDKDYRQKLDEEREALTHLSEAKHITAKKEAQAQSIGRIFGALGHHKDKTLISVIDKQIEASDLSLALAAALGDDLMASLEKNGASMWLELQNDAGEADETSQAGEAPPLPQKAKKLSAMINHPVLEKRLSQIGLVSADKGFELQKQLKQGQRLVSRQGHFWRWDGYSADPSMAKANQNRLAQWRTYAVLENEAQLARQKQNHAEEHLQNIHTQLAAIAKDLETLKAKRDQSAAQAQSILTQWQDGSTQTAQTRTKRLALDETRKRLEDEKSHQEQSQIKAKKQLEVLEKNTAPNLADEQATQKANQARELWMKAKEEESQIERALTERENSLRQIAEHMETHKNNMTRFLTQIESLDDRQNQASQNLSQLEKRPASIQEEMNACDKDLEKAQKDNQEGKKAFEASQKDYEDLRKKTQSAQDERTHARENLTRQKTLLETTARTRDDYKADIKLKYHRAPQDILTWAQIDENSALPDRQQIEHQLIQLKSDRERIGSPNLQAESERETLVKDYEAMKLEIEDLEKAVDRLRQAIHKLNREGRERFREAFDRVNHHFKEIFKTLFGGGRAFLELSEGDELEAGLEIFACPPGKKTQSMSLLSGGEKTLTALALLFANFKANPAPICVLDEVDAALDDKNVVRFCHLLSDIALNQKTRFLIVSHHPLTLSRMDRLYGVTMEEKGVSQIVSVDLEKAETLIEQSKSAAE